MYTEGGMLQLLRKAELDLAKARERYETLRLVLGGETECPTCNHIDVYDHRHTILREESPEKKEGSTVNG